MFGRHATATVRGTRDKWPIIWKRFGEISQAAIYARMCVLLCVDNYAAWSHTWRRRQTALCASHVYYKTNYHIPISNTHGVYFASKYPINICAQIGGWGKRSSNLRKDNRYVCAFKMSSMALLTATTLLPHQTYRLDH